MSKKSWLHSYVNTDDALEVFPVTASNILGVRYNNDLHAIELMVKYGISYVRARSIFILSTVLYFTIATILVWLLTLLIQDNAIIGVVLVSVFIAFCAFLLPLSIKKVYVMTGMLPAVQAREKQAATQKAVDEGLLIQPRDRRTALFLLTLTIVAVLGFLFVFAVLST